MQAEYEWLIECWAGLKRLPTHVYLKSSGFSQQFQSFARMRAKVENAVWDGVAGFGIKNFPRDRDFRNYGFFDWCMEATISRLFGLASWSIYPEDATILPAAAVDAARDFGRRTIRNYGYLTFQKRFVGPQCTVYGCPVGGSGHCDDEVQNYGAWTSVKKYSAHTLLRDIYPYNFFSRRYLDMPVEGKTLEKWILADSSRGTLEPLTSKITTWKPVIANIPVIREQLFRAGVMFYFRHFNKFDPMYRDFSKPWKPPKQIPEMFRAEFYKGQDPGLTR